MKNLVVFGDSIPKGIIYESGRIKKAKVCAVDIIAEHFGFDNVKNYSVYGQTLFRLMNRRTIDEYIDGINPHDDNYAAICIGGNDADYDWRTIALSPDEQHLPYTPLEKYAELLDEAVGKLVRSCHKVYLFTLPPVYSHLYFDNVISKIADGESVMRFLSGDVSNIYRHQELFNYEVIRCAYRNGVKLIDIRSALLKDRACSDKYCLDGVHPNESGQSFLANMIIGCA